HWLHAARARAVMATDLYLGTPPLIRDTNAAIGAERRLADAGDQRIARGPAAYDAQSQPDVLRPPATDPRHPIPGASEHSVLRGPRLIAVVVEAPARLAAKLARTHFLLEEPRGLVAFVARLPIAL